MGLDATSITTKSWCQPAACRVNLTLTLPAEGHTVQCWAECYCCVSDWPPCAQCSFEMSGDASGLFEMMIVQVRPETRTECSVGVVTTVTAVEVVKCKHCASQYYDSSHLHPKSSRLYFLHSAQNSCWVGSKQTLLSRTTMQLVRTVLHACCSFTCTSLSMSQASHSFECCLTRSDSVYQ